MSKRMKVFAPFEGIKEQDTESELSESEVEDKKMVGEKKYDNIQNEIMRRSFIMKNTLDVVFTDLKNNLKNESKSSPLVKLADDIAKEAAASSNMREKKETFECAIGANNLRGVLTVNDEAEKNNLMFLSKKVDEEEKALLELLQLH